MTTKEQKKKGGVAGCFPMCCITTETVSKKEKPVVEAPIVVKKTVSEEGVIESNIPQKGEADAAGQAPITLSAVAGNEPQPLESNRELKEIEEQHMKFTPKDKKVISLKEDDKPAADQTQIEKEAVIQPDDSTKEQKGSTAVTSNHEEPQLDKDQAENNQVVQQDANAQIEEAPADIQKEEKNDEENKADEAKADNQEDQQIEDKKEEPAKVEEVKEKPKKKSFFSYFSRKPKTPANKNKEEVVVEEALKEEVEKVEGDKVEEVKEVADKVEEAADKVEEVKEAADKVEADKVE